VTTIRHTARRGVRRVYEALGDHPSALPLLLAVTPESVSSRRVTRETDLVVEGFPRSGNTYAALGIGLAQPRPLRIVSHAHVPAQVKRAVALGVPTLVAVRDPADATCSMAVADPHHRVRDLLRYWIHYHEQLLEVRSGVVFASFGEITGRLGAVVEAVNRRFGTDLVPVADDPATREQIFTAIEDKQRTVHGEARYHEAVPRPDPQRAAEAARRREELDRTVAPAVLARARDLHRRMVESP
jgi:hypothetical protein